MNTHKRVLWTYTHKRISIIYKRVCKNTERIYVLAKRIYLLSCTCEVLYLVVCVLSQGRPLSMGQLTRTDMQDTHVLGSMYYPMDVLCSRMFHDVIHIASLLGCPVQVNALYTSKGQSCISIQIKCPLLHVYPKDMECPLVRKDIHIGLLIVLGQVW